MKSPRSLLLILVATILIGCAQVPQHKVGPGTEWFEQHQYFTAEISKAVVQLGVTQKVGIVVAPSSIMHNPLATVVPLQLLDSSQVYLIHVSEVFFQERVEQSILEHVAKHEVCHIAKKHLEFLLFAKPGLQTEVEAEDCVRSLMGNERYAQSLHVFQKWKPHHPDLKLNRQIVTTSCVFKRTC